MNTKNFTHLPKIEERHGLQFQYDENAKTFEIGKLKNALLWSALVYGMMLVVVLFAVALSFIQFTGF